MGFKLKRLDVGKLEANQELELVVHLKKEERAAIHGVVKFPVSEGGGPVENALVKLFIKKDGECDLVPVTFCFTDKCGQFLFGVPSGVEFVIKVFFFVPETRKIEKKSQPDCDCD